jgi:putative ABC transport system ATP-binding protein
MSATLVVTGLNKVYGSGDLAVHAVRDVSFSAALGNFLAIVGPSGSGKTTLLAMIGGLLTPTSGSIEIEGQQITQMAGNRQAAFRRDKVGFVFQSNNLIPFLTARENLLVMNEIASGDRREARRRADRLLAEMEMTTRATALATELSGGERQRVAIGRALMRDPLLVLVDEPTANLDSERGEQVVRSLIEEVKGRGKLGIMVTHDLRMAALADVRLEMRDGQVVQVTQQTVAEAARPTQQRPLETD